MGTQQLLTREQKAKELGIGIRMLRYRVLNGLVNEVKIPGKTRVYYLPDENIEGKAQAQAELNREMYDETLAEGK